MCIPEELNLQQHLCIMTAAQVSTTSSLLITHHCSSDQQLQLVFDDSKQHV
jgi:hypothetical protein